MIKYGMTRHWVLGLTVVLMSGEIMHLNGSLEKNNTGLDFKHLFIGSEGTLGVVTEAVLKLTRVVENTRLFFFGAKTHTEVFRLLEATRRAPFDIHAFEVFSKNCFDGTTKLHNIRSPFKISHEQYVLLETKGDNIDSWLEEVFDRGLVDEGVEARSKEEARQFWKTRETISESLRTRGQLHTSDISVPISKMRTFLEEWELVFKKKYFDWELFVFGHFGDGNLHIHALKPATMTANEFLNQNHKVEEDLFSLVQKYHGSISAEHGIGLLKKEQLHLSKSAKEISLMKSFKRIFDPEGLLNPGKVIDL